jgi:hypothetical protein
VSLGEQSLTSPNSLLFGLLDPEDEGNMTLQNITNYPPNNIVSYPRNTI